MGVARGRSRPQIGVPYGYTGRIFVPGTGRGPSDSGRHHGLEDQGVTDIVVIPLFVSSGTHVDEIAYAIGAKAVPDMETDLAPFRVRSRVHFGTPMDDAPEIAAMVWDKVKSCP